MLFRSARLRQVLVQVAYDVMQSFEMQFVRLAHAHMSGPHVAMQYLAQDAAKRALRYLRGRRLNSPSVNLHQLFLEGVFGGTSYPKQGYTLGFEDNTSCSTADLYSKCGVEGGSNLVPWKRCKPGVYGCRRPVSFEVVGQDGVGMSENPEHIGIFVQYRLVPYEYALRPLAESEDTVRQLLHRINKEHPSLVDFMRDITSTSMATNAAGASASYSGSAKANDPWTPFSDDITKPLPMRQGITRPEFEARKKEADSLYDKADYVTALRIRQELLDSISGSFPRTETCKLEFDIVQTLQALGKYDLALSILNDMSLIEECGRHFELSVARAKGVLILRGRLNDARRTLEEALEFVEHTPGDIPGVLEMERNRCKLWLAHILCQLDGNYEEALRAFNELLPRCRNHPEYFQHVHNKSLVFLRLERHKNALDLLTGALTMCEKAWTKRHPYSLILQHNIARAHLEFGHTNTGDVQERVEHVLELRTSLLGEFHPSTVETKEMLQECVKRWEMNGNGIGDNDEENLIFFCITSVVAEEIYFNL